MYVNNIDILYDEWFSNNKYWFSKEFSIDTYLCDKYLKYIIDTTVIYNNTLNGIIYDKKTLISCVLLLDQIPRHYKRINENSIDVSRYSHKAIYFSDLILKTYSSTELSIDELCFIYLPYRHVNDIDKIYDIIHTFIKLYNTRDCIDKAKCKRYLYATLNNIYPVINKLALKKYLICKKWENLNKNIFDEKSLIHANNHAYINEKSNVYLNVFEELSKLNDNSTIIISLSGGVDSIIALNIIKQLHDNEAGHLRGRKKIKNIIAVHINYNNRKESQDELDFVNYYCKLLGVRLSFRTINEIKRTDCLNNGLRDLYEDITKKIRYDMYKCNIIGDTRDNCDTHKTYVLLGHNKDDCFENIITNISNKNNYNNLCGMETLSSIEGINFWRPMLNVKKYEIVEFANNNNIPYLFDSTPEWSVRGKIRDRLKPVMCSLKTNNSNEDSSVVDSYFTLKEYISNYNEIINTIIIGNLIAKLSITDIDNCKYIGTYSKSEVSSLKYVAICSLFFQKLNIKCSHKTLKDFVVYIDKYLEHCCDRIFVLNKTNKLMIKNMKNEEYIIHINF
jgi:tRNA(Ile)-lysidine synthetase-like protein